MRVLFTIPEPYQRRSDHLRVLTMTVLALMYEAFVYGMSRKLPHNSATSVMLNIMEMMASLPRDTMDKPARLGFKP